MKSIMFVRHAKAVSRELSIPDFERSLLKKGRKDAKKIAGILKADGIKPDLLISSPANRALETAHIFGQELEYPIQKILIKENLYNDTTTQNILDIIRETNDRYSSIMIFGHNPSFDEFISSLVKNFNESVPPSGVVGIQMKNKIWKNVNRGTGTLQFYEYPIRKSEKNQIYKNARNQVEGKIIRQIDQLFTEIDADAAKKINDQITQYSKKLVNNFLRKIKTYRLKRINKDFLPTLKSKKTSGKSTPKVKRGKSPSVRKQSTKQGKPKKDTSTKGSSTK
jgi:phosphohistidine phosphatase